MSSWVQKVFSICGLENELDEYRQWWISELGKEFLAMPSDIFPIPDELRIYNLEKHQKIENRAIAS